MTDRYIEVITSAVQELEAFTGLDVESGDVSTMLRGPVQDVFEAVSACFLNASHAADHVVLSATFSHGCPGDPGEACCGISSGPADHHASAHPKGYIKALDLPVAAQFALYPLNSDSYMDTIYREIEAAKKIVTVTPEHFCTRLDGDVAAVFAVLQSALTATTADVSHVVLTATISKH
jgi:uncharacterized protein YqgV (UPF0045/DUF77 family)